MKCNKQISSSVAYSGILGSGLWALGWLTPAALHCSGALKPSTILLLTTPPNS